MIKLTLGLDAAPRLAVDGLLPLGRVLRGAEPREIRRFLATRPVYDHHVPARSDRVGRSPEVQAKRGPFGSYDQADVMAAPHLLELATQPALLDLAAAHLGQPPLLYALQARWTFPPGPWGAGPAKTQAPHRDHDDARFLVMMIFLTDVAPAGDDGRADGAHVYWTGTHETADRAAPPAEGCVVVAGPAGTALLEDGRGWHQALPPAAPRLAAWARWGVSPRNLAYVNDRTRALPVAELGDRPFTQAWRESLPLRLATAPLVAA